MPATPAAPSLSGQMLATARLAAPIIMARAGMLVLAAVDTAMTGRAGAGELARFGLGLAPQLSLMVIGVGALMGTGVLVSQAWGAGERRRCGGIWRVAVLHAGGLGLIMAGLCLLGEAFLTLIGQEPELAKGAGRVLAQFGWSMPALLMYVASVSFLEATGRTRPGMVVMILANLLNLGLNWLLIYGHLGLPALGAEGAAIATSIVRWAMFAMIVGYILLALPDRADLGVFGGAPDAAAHGRKIRRLALPLGLAQAVETTAFMAVMMIAGFLPRLDLAGYQVAMNILSVVFMCAIGLAIATAVQVGHAVGRGDAAGIRLAGWGGLAVVLVAMSLLGLGLATFGERIAGIYTVDPQVVARARAALSVAAVFLLFAGGQAVLMAASRGLGDIKVPLLVQGISFWLVGVPAADLIGRQMGLGPTGLMLGLLTGVILSSVCLFWRFGAISRRPLRRI